MSNNITSELELALKRIQSLEASLTYIRGSLVEFAKPPYRDSDLPSLFEWINARAARLIQEIDLMSVGLKRLYPTRQEQWKASGIKCLMLDGAAKGCYLESSGFQPDVFYFIGTTAHRYSFVEKIKDLSESDIYCYKEVGLPYER